MCGIYCVVNSGYRDQGSWDASLEHFLRRGPDAQGSCCVPAVSHSDSCDIVDASLHGSLLQLRGNSVASLPLVDSAGNALCFNGEIFDGVSVAPGESDSEAFLQAFAQACDASFPFACNGGCPASESSSTAKGSHCSAPDHDQDAVQRLTQQLRGPYAFVFWHQSSQQLLCGRDPLGRRSLLLVCSPGKPAVITSVQPQQSSSQSRSSPRPPAGVTAQGPHAAAWSELPRDGAMRGINRARAACSRTCQSCPGAAPAQACNVPQETPGGKPEEKPEETSQAIATEIPPGVYRFVGLHSRKPGLAFNTEAATGGQPSSIATAPPPHAPPAALQKQELAALDLSQLHMQSDLVCPTMPGHDTCLQASQAAAPPCASPPTASASQLAKAETEPQHRPTSVVPSQPPAGQEARADQLPEAAPLQCLTSSSRPWAAWQSRLHQFRPAHLVWPPEGLPAPLWPPLWPGALDLSSVMATEGRPSGNMLPRETLAVATAIAASAEAVFQGEAPDDLGGTGDQPAPDASRGAPSAVQDSMASARSTSRGVAHASPADDPAQVRPARPMADSFERSTQHAVEVVLAALVTSMQRRCMAIDPSPSVGAAWYERSAACAARQADGGSAPSCMQAPARVLVPLSGGVDSTVVAALAHACLPRGEPIDLVNVCFDGGASPDRVAAEDALEELRRAAPGREWRLVAVDSTLDEVDAHHGQCALGKYFHTPPSS
eukprot:jgi/Ulvmu1/9679/UM055_0017.1